MVKNRVMLSTVLVAALCAGPMQASNGNGSLVPASSAPTLQNYASAAQAAAPRLVACVLTASVGFSLLEYSLAKADQRAQECPVVAVYRGKENIKGVKKIGARVGSLAFGAQKEAATWSVMTPTLRNFLKSVVGGSALYGLVQSGYPAGLPVVGKYLPNATR